MNLTKVPSGFQDYYACKIGDVVVGLHAMVGDGNDPSVAMSLRTTFVGLSCSFHATLPELREFADALNEVVSVAENHHAECMAEAFKEVNP